jgi:hypothetical protein
LATNTYSGDQAVKLLEQSGLVKVQRDASGKVTRIDEAFPGAFSNPNNKPVTLQTSEVPGDASNPGWVQEATGQVTAIAFKQNPDGSLGEPVVAFDHGETQWRQTPPGGK